jgi:hypothetical protein
MFVWHSLLVPQNHPRARAAITAIQTQLPQLQMRYDPNVVQSIQYHIDLLRQLEPGEASKYQQQLNALTTTRPATQTQTSSRVPPTPRDVPKPPAPPILPPVVPGPSADLPLALPEVVPSRPVTKPVQPSAPPTDLPPAPPAPTDVPQPPLRPLPCVPVACAPVACITDIEPKKQLADVQQRALQVLQKFVPKVKNQSLDEAKKILLQELRHYIIESSRKNGLIKQKASEIRTGNQVARHLIAIDFDVTIKTYESLTIALDMCELLYGAEVFKLTKDQFEEVRTDFHNMVFVYAQALVDNIARMMADSLPSVRDAITSEQEIGQATGVIIDLAMTVHVLEMIHLPRIVLDLESSATQKKLIKNMIDLFTALQEALVQIRIGFDDLQVQPLWLKTEQKNFYDLTASVLATYVDAMPTDALSVNQKKDLYDKVKTTLNHMHITVLKMRLGPKPSVS